MVARRKDGGKISLKSIGNSFKHFGNEVKHTTEKVFSPATGKKIASTLIHQGIPILGSTLGGIAGELAAPESGPIAGYAGSFAGNQAGKAIANLVGNKTGLGLIHSLHQHIVANLKPNRSFSELGPGINYKNVIHPILHLATNGLQGTKIGKGFFSGLKKITGLAVKALLPAAKAAGKVAVSMGASALGDAVSNYTGNPAFGEGAKALAETLGNSAVDAIKEPKSASLSKEKKDVKRIARKAISLANDEVAIDEIPKSKLLRGQGIHHNRHKGHHFEMGEGMHHHHHQQHFGRGIHPTESQITYAGGNNSFNTPVQIGSPFQYTYSPAMHPFFNNVNELQGTHFIEKDYSGAGIHKQHIITMGGNMHHIFHHHSHQAISLPRNHKSGGSFIAAG